MKESTDSKGTISVALEEGPSFRLEMERGYRRLTLSVTASRDTLTIRAKGLDGESGANFFENRVGSSVELFQVLEWLDGQIPKWPLA